jgi:glucose/arabinose dehydrogenase
MIRFRWALPSGWIIVPTAPALIAAVFACSSAAGPDNRPPDATITSPAAPLTLAESTAVTFRGSATDAEDGVLDGAALDWTSSLDGDLGHGDSVVAPALSPGDHVITLTATDSRGAHGRATVALTVTPFTPGNHAPQVAILSPAPGAAVSESVAVVLAGVATDHEDGPLGGNAVAWTSSLDGALGTGDTVTVRGLSVGAHVITLTATDADGAASAASIALTVTAALPPLDLAPVASGLSQPVFLTTAPGDPSRLFVVEKTGRIRIIRNGTLQSAAFLDLSDSVTGGSEQGLLSMAFYPDYATSGRFIVSYTSPHGTMSGGTSVIARYQVSASPDAADPNSGETLLVLDQPYENHNGGLVGFGPDGYLYVGFGDGGGGGDPLSTGQDRRDLYASMLRLDVSGAGGYTIPASNPYATSATFRHELWNWGLRNPWRWSFDRQTGDLYIADVGQNEHEEVDVQPAGQGAGANYGWSIMEGFSCYNASSCNKTGITLPVLDYDHGQGCAITGGYVYRGSAIPALRGRYFYSDYCSGFVRSFVYRNGQATDRQSHPDLDPGSSVTSFGEDAAGELYILVQGGTVYRIVAR